MLEKEAENNTVIVSMKTPTIVEWNALQHLEQ